MRSLSLFALILLASVTLPASEQPYKKPKAKPYHSEEAKRSGEKQNKGSVASDKKLAPHASSSQELRRVEQQAAKTSGTKNAAKHQAHTPRVLKAEHEKGNTPIRFSSATGTKSGMNNQGKNPYKGRVRQKGSKH
jgi:hypothetical protein